MAVLRVLGLDPSLTHWGVAAGFYNSVTGEITINTLQVTRPELPTGKQVRQNSRDLIAATQLAYALHEVVNEAQAIFVEVPVGSQSARAMASYGICVGILGALRAQGISFFEVTPTEVKLAALNCKTATKKEMINWAVTKHPDAPWPYYNKLGQMHIAETQAEHMADATAAIYAGTRLSEFQRLLRMRA